MYTTAMVMVMQPIEVPQLEAMVDDTRVEGTEDRAWSTEDCCIKAFSATAGKYSNRHTDEDTRQEDAVESIFKDRPISGIQRIQNTHVEQASRDAGVDNRIAAVDSIPRPFTILQRAWTTLRLWRAAAV